MAVNETSDTKTSTTTKQSDNLQNKVLEAAAEPEGLTHGRLLALLNSDLPADRQVVVEPKTSTTTGKIEAPLSKTYTTFDYSKDVVITEQIITDGIFPNSVGEISNGAFYSSSNQNSGSKDYYITVADGNTTSSNALFDVAWGDLSGSTSASQAMYRQYANLLLPSDTDQFSFSGSVNAHQIFVISFKRARYREKLDPGYWDFGLKYSSSVANGTASFTDNSAYGTNLTRTTMGDRAEIVSGTVGATVDSHVRGWAYLDMGLLVLDGSYFSASVYNSGSLQFVNNLDNMQGRSQRRLKDINYFCRVYNKEFNYSNNPTFVTGSAGDYRFSSFATDPKVYPTTIGLYNDANELLATATISRPEEKSFQKEKIYTIRLSF